MICKILCEEGLLFAKVLKISFKIYFVLVVLCCSCFFKFMSLANLEFILLSCVN